LQLNQQALATLMRCTTSAASAYRQPVKNNEATLGKGWAKDGQRMGKEWALDIIGSQAGILLSERNPACKKRCTSLASQPGQPSNFEPSIITCLPTRTFANHSTTISVTFPIKTVTGSMGLYLSNASPKIAGFLKLQVDCLLRVFVPDNYKLGYTCLALTCKLDMLFTPQSAPHIFHHCGLNLPD